MSTTGPQGIIAVPAKSSIVRYCVYCTGTPGEALLEAFRPRAYTEAMPDGRSIAAAGCEPILYMRGFQAAKRLPDALVADVLSRKRT